jgi:hypothetical protein
MTFVDAADARWTFGRWMLAGVKVELAHIDGGRGQICSGKPLARLCGKSARSSTGAEPGFPSYPLRFSSRR